jgi:hypothetical protein
MWYAYAVSRLKHNDSQPWPHGLTPELTVVAVPITRAISILASAVPDDLFLPSADGKPTGPEDPAWVAEAAMAHHEVVLAGHLRGDVLPLRFGTVFRNEDELSAHFSQISSALEARLDAIADCDEVEVTLAADRQAIEDAIVASRSAEWESLPAGRKYLAERAARLAAQNDAVRLELEAWHGLESTLSGDIRSSVVRSPSSRAYLIQRSCKTLSDFVEKSKEQANGLRFELSGVWPPYSFAGGDLTVEVEDGKPGPDGQLLTVPTAGSEPVGARI